MKRSILYSKSLKDIIGLVGVIWLVFWVDFFLPGDFNRLGIIPRYTGALPGVLFSPFLHGSLNHLLSNSFPLIILGVLLSWHGRVFFWFVTALIIVIGGVFVWLFASPAIVVGASGLVFGYWSFLLFYSFISRRFRDLFVSLIVMAMYGGMSLTLFKLVDGVSWAAHFYGALAGLITVWLIKIVNLDQRKP